MDAPISIHEMRRRAPLHYWAKADNARFAAAALWKAGADNHSELAGQVGYGGTTSIALNEAFRREASLALELIIKAVIAQQLECGVAKPGITKVRPSHDIYSLWNEADLPQIPKEDQHRLLIAKQILYWSGRYAAPLRDSDFERENHEILKVSNVEKRGKFKIISPTSFEWKDINHLYKIALDAFEKLREKYNR